jgi:hypothetical protein
MAKLYNLARMTTTTTSTGTITLGSAVTGFLSFAGAGIANGDIIDYAINDPGTAPTASEIGTGTYTSSGTTLTRNVTSSTNSNAAINLSGNAHVFISPRAQSLQVPRSYLAGLTLSTAGSSATFGIAIGQAVDSTNLQSMQLASAYTKTTGAWTVGSGNGSLDTGTIATATWYHVYLIYRPDTGVVDVLTSLSVTSPTLPTNYTLFRRIGSMLTDGSSHWTLFNQLGDEFLWGAAVTDASGVTPATTATAQSLTVPANVVVWAKFWGSLSSTGGAGLVFEPFVGPDITAGSTGSLAAGTPIAGYGDFTIRTSGASPNQIKVRATGTTGNTYTIQLYGWIDPRGRDN